MKNSLVSMYVPNEALDIITNTPKGNTPRQNSRKSLFERNKANPSKFQQIEKLQAENFSLKEGDDQLDSFEFNILEVMGFKISFLNRWLRKSKGSA